MAEEQEPLSYLVLLTSPLDSLESIQEVTDLQQAPPHIEDPAIIDLHFKAKGTAVLLDRTAANTLQDWSARHRAIYTPVLAPLNQHQTKSLALAGSTITWPCWFFLHGDLADVAELSEPLGIPQTAVGAASRPARVTGFELKRVGDQQALVPAANTTPPPTIKLRPVHDVFSRLRHDPNMNPDDYQVVYLDRFDGEKVLDLSQWRSDVSDEDFVPQHRVLRFVRHWDSVVIWDRKARIDFVFNSNSHSAVNGLGLKVQNPTQWARLIDAAASSSSSSSSSSSLSFSSVHNPPHCMIEFTDLQSGTARGRVFTDGGL